MYKVAVAQFEPRLLDYEYNLSRIVEYTLSTDADLIVFPELATSGYVFCDSAETKSISETFPGGKSIQRLLEVSSERDISIVYGFVEDDHETLYNSSALINPDGSAYLYRKIHLFDREKLFFCPGNLGFNVHPAKNGVLIGMMICFDWQFPEAARCLALKGAQIICHPSNLVLPWAQEAMKTRSLENRVFSITSNRIGTETNRDISLTFTGAGQILGTKGELYAKLDRYEQGVTSAMIDPRLALDKTVTKANNAFADRRPEYYYSD